MESSNRQASPPALEPGERGRVMVRSFSSTFWRRMLAAAAWGLCLLAGAASAAEVQSKEPARRSKVALVLSGGGAMGIAHVGAILELERLGIRPDLVVGASMGSIVGGLYASGMNGPELEHAVETMNWDAIFDTSPPRQGLTYRQKRLQDEFPVKASVGVIRNRPAAPEGLVSDANLLLQLRRLLGARAAVPTFDDLPIPFRAVATDIETGQKVVLDRGELAGAMRASMSVPGVFAPYRLNGKLLVDGGMADNVPIDVARELGADIVIVVATQTPLAKADKVRSVPQVLGQTVTLLILANERQQLATIKPTDVLIKVDAKGLGSADFKKGAQLIAAGRESALAQEADLRRLAAELGRQEVATSVAMPPPVIDYVKVENSSRLSDQVLLGYIQPLVGRPMDTEAIVDSLQRIRALGGFTRVDFRIEQREGRTGLIVDAEQRPGDTRRLRPAITIAGAGKGHGEFDFSVEYRMLQLDANGSEARFVGTLGDRKEFSAEYFKLLDREQRWFVDPAVEWRKRPVPVYDGHGFRLGEYDLNYADGGLAFGRQFGTLAEMRAGLRAGGGKASLEEGDVIPRDVDIDIGEVFASTGLDTFDNPYFPTKGGRAVAQYTAGLTGLGSSADFQQASGSGFYTLGFGRNALIFNLEGGTTVQGTAPLSSLFTLGGPFSFPGYSIDELTGETYFAGRIIYRIKLSNRAESLFGLPVYAGATVVTGNTWAKPRDVDFSNLRIGANLYIAADTLIGPVFLAISAADRGRRAFYLFVGKPF
jgi:NTE family protein